MEYDYSIEVSLVASDWTRAPQLVIFMCKPYN